MGEDATQMGKDGTCIIGRELLPGPMRRHSGVCFFRRPNTVLLAEWAHCTVTCCALHWGASPPGNAIVVHD